MNKRFFATGAACLSLVAAAATTSITAGATNMTPAISQFPQLPNLNPNPGGATSWQQYQLVEQYQGLSVQRINHSVELQVKPSQLNASMNEVRILVDGNLMSDVQQWTDGVSPASKTQDVIVDIPTQAVGVEVGLSYGFYQNAFTCAVAVDGGCSAWIPNGLKPMLILDTGASLNSGGATEHHTIQVPLV